MKGTVEIRLHGSCSDVLEAAEILSAQGAIFRNRVYEDRGTSKQVRLYGEMAVNDLNSASMPQEQEEEAI